MMLAMLRGLAVAAVALFWAASAQAEECRLKADEVFAKASPGVVRIFSFAIDAFDPYNKVHFATGTGFILDDDVTILTNYHVVLNAVRVSVSFASGESRLAEVIAGDPILDIAVLRPYDRPETFGKVELAGSEPPKLGSDVFAIGHPMGLKTSISSGIISATGVVLPVSTLSWDAPFLQTDAAINPGNSGGPLIDACGKVVGMNTLVFPAAEDMGFAIPASTLKAASAQLIEKQRIIRPWIGISGRMADPFVMDLAGAPFAEGFLVETIEPGSAADKAGLRGGGLPIRIGLQNYLIGGDIITAVNGRPITDIATAGQVVRGLKPGDRIKLDLIRDGEEMTLEAELFERPLLTEDIRVLYRLIYGARPNGSMENP